MTRSLHTLIHYLRHSIPHRGDAALTDAQLLERWIGQRDPAAFELLLWRHGPMVLNTCRRLLARREDVEDAFQAAFLVFVRKAGSIRRREAVAAWLHRVACRIAGRARAAEVRRAGREQPITVTPVTPHIDAPALRDLHAVLDEEIESLPAHYRRALILCCLEGKSQEEAARLLNRPRGTVSSWLTRGRERLRQRLLRRGIVVSTAGLAAALTPDALASGGMIPLVGSLVRMAGAVAAGGVVPTGLMSARTLALAEGVLRMMFLTKVKIAFAVSFAVAVAAAGVGTWSHTIWAAEKLVILKEEPPEETPIVVKPVRKETPIVLKNKLEKDGVAWGEIAHGLQAGIAFRRGDQETYEVGQSVTFLVYLRNVSDKRIDLSHIEPLFDERMPYVADENGLRLVVALGPFPFGRVPIVHRSLEAGQRITLGYPWFRIHPVDWQGKVLGPTCCALPGRYKVGYIGLSLRLSDGKDISLNTKQVELNICKRETAKADHEDESASSSNDEEREKNSFRIAERYFNLGQYERALREYEGIDKKWSNKQSGLRALGESIRCFAALRDYKKCRQQVKEIRDRLRISVEMTEMERQGWLKWLEMIDDAIRHGDGKDADLSTKQMELDIRKRETAKVDGANQKAPTVEKPIPVIPAIGKAETTRLFFTCSRTLRLPFLIDPNSQEHTREVNLVVSRDGGVTWEQVDKKPPSERSFLFHAPEDGMFWFIVRQVDKQGRCKPADPSRAKPMISICVDTKPPVGTLKAQHDNKAIHLTWMAEDAHLDDKPVTLEWAEKEYGPWRPIVSEQMPSTGYFEWKLPDKMPSGLYVRIHVRDKAGNDSYTGGSYFNLKNDE